MSCQSCDNCIVCDGCNSEVPTTPFTAWDGKIAVGKPMLTKSEFNAIINFINSFYKKYQTNNDNIVEPVPDEEKFITADKYNEIWNALIGKNHNSISNSKQKGSTVVVGDYVTSQRFLDLQEMTNTLTYECGVTQLCGTANATHTSCGGGGGGGGVCRICHSCQSGECDACLSGGNQTPGNCDWSNDYN